MMLLFLSLTLQSFRHRKITIGLSILAIAISMTLLLGVEKLRVEAKNSFANTISGTDLIIGARSGSLQLLLYSVFRIGNATNNVSWESYQDLSSRPEVKWSIPLSLGDSHRGYRVLGTTQAYFDHYKYANNRELDFAKGERFNDLFDVVLGADVAATLNYDIGTDIVIAHGIGAVSFSRHDDKPFRVSGILNKTGTPIDQTLHVSLAAIEAIHVDWRGGGRVRALSKTIEEVRQMDLTPKSITAFMVGLKTPLSIFKVQRYVNAYPEEPLLAVLPGVALTELWHLMGTAETALLGISIMVVFSGILGMMIMMLTNLNERRREMAIFRSVGARPQHIFFLYMFEVLIITSCAVITSLIFLYSGLFLLQPMIETEYGLFINITPPTRQEVTLVTYIVITGFIAGVLPAYRGYRYSLADGMTIRH